MRTFTVVLNILKNLGGELNFVVPEINITNKKFIVKHDHDEIHSPHNLKV